MDQQQNRGEHPLGIYTLEAVDHGVKYNASQFIRSKNMGT